jgi:hypothetical protein
MRGSKNVKYGKFSGRFPRRFFGNAHKTANSWKRQCQFKLAYFINCDKGNHFWITPATGWLLELFDVNTVFTVAVVMYRLLVLVNVT